MDWYRLAHNTAEILGASVGRFIIGATYAAGALSVAKAFGVI